MDAFFAIARESESVFAASSEPSSAAERLAEVLRTVNIDGVALLCLMQHKFAMMFIDARPCGAHNFTHTLQMKCTLCFS